jgi:hypothetical protein
MYHKAHLVHVFPSRLGAGNWRPGAFLVSPFNVKWRFSEPVAVVEGSKLCLFSVIMPTKCVSSVSLRFHYRRLAFCFLPLAAILESPESHFFNYSNPRFLLQAVVPLFSFFFFFSSPCDLSQSVNL